MIRGWGAKWSTYLGRIVKSSWARQLRMLISMRDKTCVRELLIVLNFFAGEGAKLQSPQTPPPILLKFVVLDECLLCR